MICSNAMAETSGFTITDVDLSMNWFELRHSFPNDIQI